MFKTLENRAAECQCFMISVSVSKSFVKRHAKMFISSIHFLENVQSKYSFIKKSEKCASHFFGPNSKTCIFKVRAAWGHAAQGLLYLESELTGAILECNQRIITITKMLVLDCLASPQTIAMDVFFAFKYYKKWILINTLKRLHLIQL